MSTRAALQAWLLPPWAMVLDGVGHVEDVVVDSAVRGKGIDRETVPIESGCYKVSLDCGEENAPSYTTVTADPVGQ
jgi:hypothetical protein